MPAPGTVLLPAPHLAVCVDECFPGCEESIPHVNSCVFIQKLKRRVFCDTITFLPGLLSHWASLSAAHLPVVVLESRNCLLPFPTQQGGSELGFLGWRRDDKRNDLIIRRK